MPDGSPAAGEEGALFGDDIEIEVPSSPGQPGRPSRYKRIWRQIVVITSLIAILPMLCLTVFLYVRQTRESRIDSRQAVSRHLSTTKRNLETAIEERRGALALLLSQTSYRELATDAGLAAALHRLQEAFGGFADLGLIDSRGKQVSYSGSYDLKGKNYRDQDWFHETLLRGAYVSDVFMGYRNFPHFVLAVRHKKSGGDVFVVRATLDMDLLNNRIHELDARADAFIVNRGGVLQTSSAFFGPALKKTDVRIPPRLRDKEVLEEGFEDGVWTSYGWVAIKDTPFILVVVKRHAGPFRDWVGRHPGLVWFLGLSVALILTILVLGTNRMVSSLKRADERRAKSLHDLEYTNKLATIGRMAASVAHEINNPLAIISEDAGLLMDMANFSDDYPEKEKTLGVVRSIQKSVERCSDVTHRLLGFAKRMDLRREPISLSKLLEEVVAFQKTEVAHRNIHIEYLFPDVAPPIESDRGKLQQVFLNILTNALAAVEDGGRINIRVTQIDNNNEAVVVSDNGSGISEEQLEHIFEPFYSTKGEFGTGLGLSITRDIVAKLGGTIDVQSKVGRGTSFIVTLPIRPKE